MGVPSLFSWFIPAQLCVHRCSLRYFKRLHWAIITWIFFPLSLSFRYGKIVSTKAILDKNTNQCKGMSKGICTVGSCLGCWIDDSSKAEVQASVVQ